MRATSLRAEGKSWRLDNQHPRVGLQVLAVCPTIARLIATGTYIGQAHTSVRDFIKERDKMSSERFYSCKLCSSIHIIQPIPNPLSYHSILLVQVDESLLQLDHHIRYLDILLFLVLGCDLEDDVLLMVWYRLLADVLNELAHPVLCQYLYKQ